MDDLVRKLNVPPRFKDHKPKWSTEKREVTFEFMDGPTNWPFWFVRDGAGVVAVIPTVGFHTGTVYVQDFRPGHAPKKVPFPTERWHIDTAVGTELRTNNFIPGEYGSTDASYDWKVSGDELVLVRRFKGTTKYSRWAHQTKTAVKADATNTIVFRVDPQLGYVVDATYDIWTDQPPGRYEYSSATTSGRYLLWPGQATCFRHVITPAGADGLIGYACNHGVTKLHGSGSCRDGGFVGFLNDETGWSPTLVLTKGNDSAHLGVCGAHTDLDFILPWPKDAKTRDDGLKHNGDVRLRLLALPPELTRYCWDNMKLLHGGEHKLMIRFGVLEDFEDQPLELTTRQRGMPWGAQVTDQYARSGRKSITFSGQSGHGDPQIALKPSTHYRLEAYVRIADWTAEQRKADDDAQREKIEKAKKAAEEAEKRGKTPRPVPEFKPAGPAGVYLRGWTYQWSPHVNKPVEVYKSNVATVGEGKPEWQKVSFDLTTPKWAPFIQLSFHADYCTAWLDDFRFVTVDEKK